MNFKSKKISFLLLTMAIALLPFSSKAQKEEKQKKPSFWQTTIDLGLSANSTNSSYARFAAPSYSIGFLKSWKRDRKLNHAIQYKLNLFTESFKNIPYYYLENNKLVSTTFNQRNTYPMLFLGWKPKYNLTDNIFIQGGVGFNFMFFQRYKRKLSNGTGKLNTILPPNRFINRPEISLGIGINKQFLNRDFSFVPKISYNGTLGTKNITPSFYTFSIETIFKIRNHDK